MRGLDLKARRARGVTILELLIVITIMLMVTAAAIPIMLPALANRQMREASRLVSSYISGARARAIETGRPVGVVFERFNGLPFAMTLSYVEVPQPYAGDTVGSRVKITGTAISQFVSGDTQWQGLVRVGDVVKLNYGGKAYVISSVGMLAYGQAISSANDPSMTSWNLIGTDGSTPNFPASFSTGVGVPFQIFRQPVRSSVAPLQLPEGTVVDLYSSGGGTTAASPSLPLVTLMPPVVPTPVTTVGFNPVITFAPSGSVDYFWVPTATRVSSPTYFLVGRRELMPDVSQTGTDENMYEAKKRHMQNFWVAVGAQTGHVGVTENGNTTGSSDFTNARTFAQQAQSVGGR